MKILHTADWHVGRRLRGRSRADEHRAVLREIVEIADREKVDLVLVAGDQFDFAAPTPESEQIVYRTILDLAETGAHVALIAGNHDNPNRLEAIGPLLELTSTTTSAFARKPDEGGVAEVEVRSGETARIALLPFLSKRSIIKADQLMAADADDHTATYIERARRIVEALCAGFNADAVNIVLSHLAVAGGQMGGGERTAHMVEDYFVPSQIFPPSAHYVAMGHLHRPQQIAGACPIWYPGSPLHLDFGEKPGEKCVLLIDAEPGVPAKVERVELQEGRRLRTLEGSLAEIEAQAGEMGEDFLRVILDEPRRAGLADDVRAMLPNAVDVIIASDDDDGEPLGWEAEGPRSPQDLFADYLAEKRIEDPALESLFADLLEDDLETTTA